MADRVPIMKWESPETGGTETDVMPMPLNPAEDSPMVKGVYFQRYVGPEKDDHTDDETVGIERDNSDKLTFWDDDNPTPVDLATLVAGSGGLTEEAHRTLDQLAHNLAEDYYEEYTYTGSKVTNATVWTDSGKTKKIREEQYTYSGNKVTQVVTIQYDSDGNEFERLTETYTYDGSKIDYVTAVRTTP